MLIARSKALGCTNVRMSSWTHSTATFSAVCSLLGLVEKERRSVYAGDAKAAPGKGNGKASRPAAKVENRLRPHPNEPKKRIDLLLGGSEFAPERTYTGYVSTQRDSSSNHCVILPCQSLFCLVALEQLYPHCN